MDSHIYNAHDISNIQHDIDSLLWSKKWQLPFNIFKCKLHHLGRSAPDHTYQICIQIIEQVTKEKDLEIIVDNLLKFHQYVSFATSKAMRIIGVIQRTFCFMPTNTFLSLYKH